MPAPIANRPNGRIVAVISAVSISVVNRIRNDPVRAWMGCATRGGLTKCVGHPSESRLRGRPGSALSQGRSRQYQNDRRELHTPSMSIVDVFRPVALQFLWPDARLLHAVRYSDRRCDAAGMLSELVEHQVNDNASHADIQPDRQGPPGDALVAVEPAFKRAPQRDDRQHRNRRRQYRVGEQNGQ